MDLGDPDRASNAPCCLDLFRRHLRLFVGVRIGLDSRPHPRIVSCGGDDLFMAVGSGSAFICDSQNFWSGIADLIAVFVGIIAIATVWWWHVVQHNNAP